MTNWMVLLGINYGCIKIDLCFLLIEEWINHIWVPNIHSKWLPQILNVSGAL